MMDFIPKPLLHDEKFQHFFAQTDAIAVQGFDQDLKVTYWNLASEKLYGYTSEQAVGRKICQLIIPPKLQLEYKNSCISYLLDDKTIPSNELSLQHVNGEPIDVLVNHIAIRHSADFGEIYKIDIDLSKQKKIESLIQHEQSLMTSIFNALPDLFFLMDAEGVICDYSVGDKDNLHISPLEFLGKKLLMVLPADIALMFDEYRIAALNSQQMESFEYQIESPQGRKDFEARIISLEDKSQLVAIVRDITEKKLIEQNLFDRDKLYRQIFEKNQAIKLVIDPDDGKVIEANEAAVQFYGYTFEQLTSMSITEINTLSESEVFNEMQNAKKEERLFFNFQHRLASGEIKDVEVYSGPIEIANKTLIYSIIQDVSKRNNAERALKSTEQQLRDLLNHATAVIYMKDLQGRYICINRHFEDLLNIKESDTINKTAFQLFPKKIASKLQENDQIVIDTGAAIEIEEIVPLGNCDHIYHSVKYPLINDEGEMYAICGISTDITERKSVEKKVLHQAHFDMLTNLPNRLLALDRLSQLVEEAKRDQTCIAVLFLDLDDFKKVNDSLGHDVGDKLLIEAALRLNSVVRNKDTVGRLGGDEFIVLLGGLSKGDDAAPVIDHLLQKFREPFVIENRQLILTASIGISVYPDDAPLPNDLLRCADTAMYQAKHIGRNTYSYFTQAMNKDISRRLELEEQIRDALERNEFEVYYQPQYDLTSLNIIGAEALLRWKSPILGHVSPGEFIPIAEHTGIIVPLGQFVFLQALKMLVKWQSVHHHELRMAINLSPRQFRDPKLVTFISDSLKDANLPATCIELEITEGVLMSGHGYIKESLEKLHELGIILSMDDFGTGYSSLSYLREYPFKVLKIDRCFVDGLTKGKADKELVIATIAMAHALGLKVVAEGIEEQTQLDILTELQCDYAQGYLMGKPMPEQNLLSLPESIAIQSI